MADETGQDERSRKEENNPGKNGRENASKVGRKEIDEELTGVGRDD